MTRKQFELWLKLAQLRIKELSQLTKTLGRIW